MLQRQHQMERAAGVHRDQRNAMATALASSRAAPNASARVSYALPSAHASAHASARTPASPGKEQLAGERRERKDSGTAFLRGGGDNAYPDKPNYTAGRPAGSSQTTARANILPTGSNSNAVPEAVGHRTAADRHAANLDYLRSQDRSMHAYRVAQRSLSPYDAVGLVNAPPTSSPHELRPQRTIYSAPQARASLPPPAHLIPMPTRSVPQPSPQIRRLPRDPAETIRELEDEIQRLLQACGQSGQGL